MDVKLNQAAAAYSNTAKIPVDTKPEEESGNTGGTSGFANMVGDSLRSAVSSMYKGEAASVKSLAGGVDLTDLVTAVSSAELTVQTVVAVRDRVISAYQDILRMPI